MAVPVAYVLVLVNPSGVEAYARTAAETNQFLAGFVGADSRTVSALVEILSGLGHRVKLQATHPTIFLPDVYVGADGFVA